MSRTAVIRCAAAAAALVAWTTTTTAIAGAAPPAAPARTNGLVSTAQAPSGPLEQRIDDAFLAAFPLYEMARARYNAAVHPLNPQPLPPNGRPINRRALIDHTARDVTTPNNDTLYSAGWLDLHDSPVRLRVPKVEGGRYYSIALIDVFTHNFAILGSRLDGSGPIDVVVAGPQWKGPLPKGRVLRAPTNDVQVIGRFLVNGAADAPAVHRLQDGLSITPVLAGARPVPQWVAVTTSTDPANFLAVVNEFLWRNPVPREEAAAFQGWADLGIGGGADAFVRTRPEVQAAWKQRLPVLHEALKAGLRHGSREVAGWGVPAPQVGLVGADPALRAAVAFGGLSALPATEAVYLNLESDPQGRPLDGNRRWKLVVPPLEAKAFWSLSMYEKDAEGRLFFTANPLGRYAIGDRTAGIQRRADGAIEVLLQHEAPAGGTANWLPTPRGPFAITLRAYLPSDAMRRGEAPLPRLMPGD